jgi:hypothetical protein
MRNKPDMTDWDYPCAELDKANSYIDKDIQETSKGINFNELIVGISIGIIFGIVITLTIISAVYL